MTDNNPHFDEWYDVLVTGTIISETPNVRVERMPGVVATTYAPDHPDHDYFKVWPKDDHHPGLPKNHDGKLWFLRSEATVEVISDENGDPVGVSDE